jgi:ferredoxin/flavodoxin
MKPNSATLLYWSPTGTTRKLLHAIADGMALDTVETISLTHPKERQRSLHPIQSDALLVGMPVYEERVPAPVLPFLRQLQGTQQPGIPVAVYGNVGAGIALRQLSTALAAGGFRVVAGASFVAEHSFSHDALPVAAGRPDANDLQIAQAFGAKLAEKLASIEDVTSLDPVSLPGRLPLKARILPKNSARLFTQAPLVNLNACTHCKACVGACPMGAIDNDSLVIDETVCLRCFACVRTCRFAARAIVLRKRWLVRRALRKARLVPQRPYLYL